MEADEFVISPVTGLPVAAAANNSGDLVVGSDVTSASSTITRAANTTAYTQNTFIGAGSSFIIATPSVSIPRVRIKTNVTTGWDQVVVRVHMWSVVPTYGNADNGAYAVTCGAAVLLGQFDVILSQFADCAQGFGIPSAGAAAYMKQPTMQVFFDLEYVGAASITPISGQTFAVTADLVY